MSSANNGERLTGLSAPEDTPDCHVIPKLPVVDTEVDFPPQFFPANVDPPILTHCKKPCASAPLREIILFAL